METPEPEKRPPPVPATDAAPAPPLPARAKKPSRWAWAARLAPLLVAAGLLAAVVAGGRQLREWLRLGGGVAASIDDIDFDPPPGLTRAAFLDEVRFIAGLPGRVNLLDADDCERLKAAFAAHPWTRSVTRLKALPGGKARLDLWYRVPALALGETGRAVDAAGVLLPARADVAGLPVYRVVATKGVEAGKPWPDAAVVLAAAVAGDLAEVRSAAGLDGAAVTVHDGIVTFGVGGRRLIWGGRDDGRRKREAVRAGTWPADGVWDVR